MIAGEEPGKRDGQQPSQFGEGWSQCFLWHRRWPVASGVWLLLLLGIVTNALWWWNYEQETTEHGQHHAELSSLEADTTKYKREIEVLEGAADVLRQEIENAPSKTTVRVVRISDERGPTALPPGTPPDHENTPTPEPLPLDCITCFRQVEIPYQFTNQYVVLTDLLRWNERAQTLESDPDHRAIRFTPEFNRALVDAGIAGFVTYDNRVARARFFFGVDGGVALADTPVFGVGAGLEFLNFEKWIRAPIGLQAGFFGTPMDWWQSHASLGLSWRFVRNVSLNLSYGRAWRTNQVLLGLSVYPFD
jgi:hypothetical protein